LDVSAEEVTEVESVVESDLESVDELHLLSESTHTKLRKAKAIFFILYVLIFK